ncbi:MAG: hypothetical protein WAX66_03125, partial [Patescibacteria group bacterium]
MLSFIKSYIIYSYNDSALGFLRNYYRNSNQFNKISGTSLNILDTVRADYLTSTLTKFLSRFLDFVTLNNLFVLLAIGLSILFAYKLFRNFSRNFIFPLIFSILYSTSIYFLNRVTSATTSLYFIFLFPLVVDNLIKDKKPLLIGMIVFLSLLVSSYYGYFLFITVLLWYLSLLISKRNVRSKALKSILIFVAPVAFGVIVFFGSVFVKNVPLFGNYSKTKNKLVEEQTSSVYRAVDDWYAFSFRPWYPVIPPKNSLFFGNLSKNIYSSISKTNYYLADDYAEQEMAGSYIGWHFILGMGSVAILLLLKRFKNKEYPAFRSVYENREVITRSFLIVFCILLISGPPSFTISGVTIYTPSYLLYYVMPVFRVLVRWAVVVYLFVLVINVYFIQDLYTLMKEKWQKGLFIFGFLILNFVIFAVRIPIININEPPLEVSYLKQRFPESVPYAVYPKGDFYSIFWVISHKDLLINPTNLIDYKIGFDANEFSDKLITQE